MNPGRHRLLRLNTSEIKELLNELTPLPIMWARPAKVSKELLSGGSDKAINAVRTQLRRSPKLFHEGLAWAAVTALVQDGDPAHAPEAVASREGAERLSSQAEKVLGGDLGAFVVNIVAESDLPLADLVRTDLGEFVALATRGGVGGHKGESDSADLGDNAIEEPSWPSTPTAAEIEPELGAAQLDASATFDSESEPDAEIDPATKPSEPVTSELAAIRELLRGAPTIARNLRVLADEVEETQPSADAATVLSEAEAWVTRVHQLVSGETTLAQLAVTLESAMNAQLAKLDDLQQLRDAARSLGAGGHSRFVDTFLAQHDFANFAALTQAIEALEGIVAQQGSHGEAANPREGSDGAVGSHADDESEPERADPVDTEAVSLYLREPDIIDHENEQQLDSSSDRPDDVEGESREVSLSDIAADALETGAASVRTDQPTAATSVVKAVPDDEGDGVEASGPGDYERIEPLDSSAETVDVELIVSAESAERSHTESDRIEPAPDAAPSRGPRPAAPMNAVDSVLGIQPSEAGEPRTIDPSEVTTSDPWATGEIAGLIGADRERLAVLMAEAYGTGEARTRMLRLFAGAYGTRAETLLVQEPDLMLDESPEDERNADDNRLLFAAHARLALELGFSPAGSMDRLRQAAALDGHPVGELATEIVRLTNRGFKRPLGAVALTALPDDWRVFEQSAQSKLESLRSIRLTFQRASRIIHHLARADQPIGSALTRSSELAQLHASGHRPDRDAWADVESVLAILRSSQQRDRLVTEADRAVSTPQQLRNAVIATARDKLYSALDEVAGLLEEGLALRTRSESSGAADDPQGMADLIGLAQRAPSIPGRTVGDAALQRLVDWLRTDVVVAQPPTPLAKLIADELLPVFEIPRDSNNVPTRTVPTVDEMQTLIDGRDSPTVLTGYLSVGNIEAAHIFLARSITSRTAAIDDEFAQAEKAHARRHRELTAEIDRALDSLRSLHDDDQVRRLARELDAHRAITPGRYDIHLSVLEEIRSDGESQLAKVRDDLRERALRIANQKESARILVLLESKDEQLAVDYLTLAEAGEALPELTPPAGDDFGEFFPRVVRVAESANGRRAIDNISEVRNFLGAPATPANRMLNQGLKSWVELAVDGRAGQMTPGRLANVLRMLGLIPPTERWVKDLTKERYAGYATYAVKANPFDRSYVPSFGSQAHGSYNVTIVWEERSPKALLNHIETDRRTQANIILYLKTLSVEQRIELRKLTARPGFEFSPIVVDVPVIAWLSTRDEPGWRVTQRVTLPFTTLNPYTPFAGGEVPDEVFVGRESERREIIEPTGSMFVYGGRQLGKSALLRRVERGLMSDRGDSADAFEHGHIAVYLDLKSEGIGESAEPAALWGALAPRLRRAGVLPAGTSDVTADAVASGILEWLEADQSRRLLLLMDEADNFLTLDAKAGPNQTGSFPVLQKLKGVMEQSGRRFKPVFAGLHQVQRFHSLPNTPVVHGGQDILIGPLTPVDARELVRDPLLALGYEFETPDTMWRLLRLTNYQASLIQIICESLVRHMRTTELPLKGGRVIIRARDVDDVYAMRDVRELIAQRFRWTINLDSRYKVIALVTALRSLGSKPGERFRASDLHDECEFYWPAGFSRSTLSRSEFFRYLDEMQGLGVLHRQGEDEFGLRSPSILGLLGSRETIESELLDASEQLEVSYQYNPAMNRRILTQDAAGVETRSPLTDSDLADLLSHAPGEPDVKVVSGTKALGLRLVTSALHKAAKDRSIRAIDVDAVTLRDQLGGNDDAHLILDLTSADASTRRSALHVLAASAGTHVTVVLPSADLPLENGHANWPVISLQRWSLEGLSSLHEFMFKRQDLKSATGGWPGLVEKATLLVIRGAKTESALETIADELRDSTAARQFLGDAEIPLDIAKTWLAWFATEREGDGDPIELTPASIEDLNTAFESDAGPLLDRLQTLDAVDEAPEGWMLDRVVAFAAWRAQG